MSMNVEADNRTVDRIHFKLQFGYFKEHRINDDFASDKFFPLYDRIKEILVVNCSWEGKMII